MKKAGIKSKSITLTYRPLKIPKLPPMQPLLSMGWALAFNMKAATQRRIDEKILIDLFMLNRLVFGIIFIRLFHN